MGQEDPLEKGMATHCSILARRIPWTEELVGCSSWGPKDSDMTKRLTFHFGMEKLVLQPSSAIYKLDKFMQVSLPL